MNLFEFVARGRYHGMCAIFKDNADVLRTFAILTPYI